MRKGPFYALLAAALFGVSPPLAKRLVGDINPQFLAGLLYLGSGAGLAVVLLGRRAFAGRRTARERMTAADWGWLTGAIAFGGVIAPVLLMKGLAQTAA